jgi:hypothetical protein
MDYNYIHPDDDCYDGPGSNYEYCKYHPSQVVSNGMFDAPCGACEAEGDDEAEKWEHNRDNPYRSHCGLSAFGVGLGSDAGYFLDEEGKLRWLKTGEDCFRPGLYYPTKPTMCVSPVGPFWDDNEIPF